MCASLDGCAFWAAAFGASVSSDVSASFGESVFFGTSMPSDASDVPAFCETAFCKPAPSFVTSASLTSVSPLASVGSVDVGSPITGGADFLWSKLMDLPAKPLPIKGF